jgi:hypothetical protein
MRRSFSMTPSAIHGGWYDALRMVKKDLVLNGSVESLERYPRMERLPRSQVSLCRDSLSFLRIPFLTCLRSPRQPKCPSKTWSSSSGQLVFLWAKTSRTHIKFSRSKERQKESISIPSSGASVEPRSQKTSGSISSSKPVWIRKTCQRHVGSFLRDCG